ncbi:hypothetical protein K9N68_16785 [Kovacikia minuta CCNUW1]|uniref:hypothetical protein n=1 Tax=Kovacikia minuta TaxID=2931930 RepID=UPI001CCFCEAC|nr:hypothetical protein [Kovacikia minuta]UBF29340.1 hypothetical protein K9N68_16785 [Kovacikia minuta CCNUW1]
MKALLKSAIAETSTTSLSVTSGDKATMSRTSNLWIFLSLSSVFLVSLNQKPALAGDIFTTIDRAINTIDRTINKVEGTVQFATAAVNRLTKLLDIKPTSSGSSVSGNTTTEQVLNIYQTWYKGLSAPEQEIISWLVMEYARDREVTFATISSSEWFMQKPLQQQQLIGGLFFKLNEIVKVVSNEKSKFLSFAFCVNSGGQGCKP